MAIVTRTRSLSGPAGDASATLTYDDSTYEILTAEIGVAARDATVVGLYYTYLDAQASPVGSGTILSASPSGVAPGDVWSEVLSLGAPFQLDVTKQWEIRLQLAGSQSGSYSNDVSEPLIPSVEAWAPQAYPVGTIVASGTFTPTGETCVIGYNVETFLGAYNGVYGYDLLPIYTLVSGSIGTNRVVVMDIKDRRGTWRNAWATYRPGVVGGQETSLPVTFSTVAPQVPTEATQRANVAARGVATPSGWGHGVNLYAGSGPGHPYATQRPTKVGFRYSSDPLGTYFHEQDVLDIFPPYNEALLSENLAISVTIGMDTASGVEVTGPSPGAGGDGVPPVGATPVPGGVEVTTPDGPVYVPLPGGTPNGPITVRIVDGKLVIIYDGAVIYLYELTPEDYSALTTSGSYVGVWDPLAGTVTPDDDYPAVYPPLGGWSYRLLARDRQPLGLAPRLFYAWATRWQGLSVAYWPGTGAVEFMEDYPQEYETDPDVVVYPGGREWLVNATVATAIARAGGLAYLTEVAAPTP